MANKKPFVSVIILNYNGLRFLDRCLSSVLNTDYDNFEVIFVDNGSTDGSVEFVKEKFGDDPRLKIIQNKENLGFSGGNNVGIRQSRGKYIVLLNNDTVVESEWLTELVGVMEKRKDIGMAQPAILYMDTDRVQTLGNLLDGMLMLVKSIGQGYRFPKKKIRKAIRVTYPLGACLIVRRSLLRKIGLFDEKFLIYHDDTYWGVLSWLAGLKAVSILSATIYHKGRATLSKFKKGRLIYFNTKSRVALILEIWRKKDLFMRLSSFLFMWSAYIVLKSMSDRFPGYIKSMLYAYFWVLRNMKHILTQRKVISQRIGAMNYKLLNKALLPNPFVFKNINKLILEKIGVTRK
ncbi:MAG: glycosyltransferase family 2 protein [Candidatus Njordarchaeota archaeon]